jgi:hypothetical protein
VVIDERRVGSARQDGRDTAGSDGQNAGNRPCTTHERFPHRHSFPLPVEQDQEPSEAREEASEHRGRFSLCIPDPAGSPSCAILPLTSQGGQR